MTIMKNSEFRRRIIASIEAFERCERESPVEHTPGGLWGSTLISILQNQGIWFMTDGSIFSNPVASYVESYQSPWDERRAALLEAAWEFYQEKWKEQNVY